VLNARNAGITVVVAAGNTGGEITNPAYDGFALTVGATDMQGTTNPADDKVATFSSTALGGRTVDLLAPGKSIVSLRDPGSYADTTYPSARVGDRYFVGSGTSQAAAVVTGAAAVVLQRYPTMNPDTVKCTLLFSGTAVAGSGKNTIDLDKATTNPPVGCGISGAARTGTGKLQDARGTSIVTMNGVSLTGERDIFGTLSTAAWGPASTAGTAWQGGSWMGRAMTGTGWGTTTYGQPTWSGRAWSGTSWTGRAWSDIAWSGATWTGRAWSNTTVNGVAWAGRAWSGVSWQSAGNGAWMP
jgi:serine protease AprX